MEGKKEKKSDAGAAKFSFISGAQHVIISRKSAFQLVLIVLSAFFGMLVAERLRLNFNLTKINDSRGAMKGINLQLKAEKDDYKNLFTQMTEQLEEWKSAHDLSLEHQKTRIDTFKESSEALMLGLDDVRTVLEEKEFQLWEKEGLLEYQEERLLDSEDQEVQMALYINVLAQNLLALNVSLPEGLEEQPYYGQERARSADDDAVDPDDADADADDKRRASPSIARRRRRHRQLRARPSPAASPPSLARVASSAVKSYRDHLIRETARKLKASSPRHANRDSN